MYACLLHFYDLFSELEPSNITFDLLSYHIILIRHMTFITRFFVGFFLSVYHAPLPQDNAVLLFWYFVSYLAALVILFIAFSSTFIV